MWRKLGRNAWPKAFANKITQTYGEWKNSPSRACRNCPHGHARSGLRNAEPLLGDTLMVKLLQSSLDSFKLNIKWSDLPKTFQETILVALRLNIHWLWIDALCIIQDDNDDWLREAASMVKFIPARNSASLQTPRKMARKAFSAKGTRNSDDRSTFRTVKAQHRLHGP